MYRSWLSREHRRGLSTQPCVMFRVIVEEERLSNLADWGLFVR